MPFKPATIKALINMAKNLGTPDIPMPAELEVFLEKMASEKQLIINPGLDELGEIVSAAGIWQNRAGHPGNGAITTKLIGALTGSSNCPPRDPNEKDTTKRFPANADIPNVDVFNIRYKVELNGFPTKFGSSKTITLIAEAFELWTDLTKFLLVRESPPANDPNLTIRKGSVNGGVAEAPLAGPGQFSNMVITVDSKPNWDAGVFRAVVCHEIGHVLGLAHTTKPMSLMNPVIPMGVLGPMSEDIVRIQDIYGAAPTNT